MSEPPRAIRHPLLEACGVAHGFGVRGAPVPGGLLRPRQVHGAAVAEVVATASGGVQLQPAEADAVVSSWPGVSIAIATADCVPVLASSQGGAAVAAIHAGWRGFAAGVLGAGIGALRRRAGAGARLVAAIGPYIGPCCYEVDAPVLRSLRSRFGGELARVLEPTRPGHWRLDLGALARLELIREGLEEGALGGLSGACTCCDAGRFHSYRRDGERAGRLVHHLAARDSGVLRHHASLDSRDSRT
jgi:YfiH family protein